MTLRWTKYVFITDPVVKNWVMNLDPFSLSLSVSEKGVAADATGAPQH
jgi:hypothetical protein